MDLSEDDSSRGGFISDGTRITTTQPKLILVTVVGTGLFVCVCACMCVCVCLRVCVCVCWFVCVYMYVWVLMCASGLCCKHCMMHAWCVCVCVCLSLRVCFCVCVGMQTVHGGWCLKLDIHACVYSHACVCVCVCARTLVVVRESLAFQKPADWTCSAMIWIKE